MNEDSKIRNKSANLKKCQQFKQIQKLKNEKEGSEQALKNEKGNVKNMKQ